MLGCLPHIRRRVRLFRDTRAWGAMEAFAGAPYGGARFAA
ncbi:Hypothetical protein AA314_09458 [Archangium gephyra]|uniref:Uncharacterized protein n=1 Tax=Archangium gephyra TaxID=48 RepID=A0AAC8TJ20_9BACT|nr:Hypothetical protein AA314_09458 [Archangium gephyra]